MKLIKWMLAGLLLATQVQAAEESVPMFGDWAKKCDAPAEGETVCYIVQTATNKENGQMIMQVRVGYPPSKDQPIMITTVPLGTLLPPGARLYVGDQELVKFQFLACDRAGCTTGGAQLTPEMIDAMRKAESGQVRVALINRKVVPLPVSFKGFTRAFNAISPQ